MGRTRNATTAGLAVALVAASVWLASPSSALLLTAAAASMGSGVVGTTVPASLSISNSSTPPESSSPITYSGIDFYPSCYRSAPPVAPDCANGTLEPSVFTLEGAVVGVATPAGNSSCEGTWTMTQASPGRWRLVPPGGEGSLSLGAGQICDARVTARILRMPSDVDLGTPGVQTYATAGVSAAHPLTPNLPRRGDFTTATVSRATPVLSTTATSAATVGDSLIDVATVTGAAAPAATPSGSVTFRVYGPNDESCAGTPTTVGVTALAGGPPPMAISAPFTPATAGVYRWAATYGGDANYVAAIGACNAAGEASTVAVQPSGRYHPLSPVRVLDTRDGTGGITGAIGPGGTVEVQIAGRGGIPASGVLAVAMNVTVTQPTAASYMTIYPAASPRPWAANLTYTPGKTVPNLVVAKLGAGGRVAVFNSAGSTQVIFDVAGWYSDVPSGNDGRFIPVVPARILDTRDGTGGGARLGPGASLDLQVSGQGGVPATGVEAAVVNVAATGTTATGFLTLYPTGEARPLAANLNFNSGDTVSNRAVVKLGAGGRVTVYNALGSADVIVDVGAWFTDASVPGTGGVFTPLYPARILDTRYGTGGITGPLAARSIVDVQVSGQGGVPATGVNAVVFTATVVGPGAMGFLTFYPTGTARPLVSDLNYASGETRANLVMPWLGTGGRSAMYTAASANVVVDVAGWYS